MGLKGFWSRKTNLEKVLICCVAILCLVVVILFISFLVNNDTGFCHSPQCVRNAMHLIDSIDPSADPCKDFYQFACGTFIQNSYLHQQPNSLNQLRETTKNRLKAIVTDENRNETNLPRMVVQQRKFYRTCLNKTNIDADENASLLKVLDDVLGGWPVTRSYSWNDRNFEWSEAVIKARQNGVHSNFFFDLGVYRSIKGRNVLKISPLGEKYVSLLELKEKNIEHIAEIAKYLGAQSIGINTELRRAMYFSEQLDQIIEAYHNSTMDDDYVYTTENSTISDFNVPKLRVDWLLFLQQMSGLNLTQQNLIVNSTGSYLDDLANLLMKTPKKILASYMGWAIIANSINFCSSNIRDKFMEIKEVDKKNTENMDNNEICYKLAKDNFKDVAEAEYVRMYTTKEKKAYVTDMLQRLKKELRLSLEATNWLDKESKANEMKHFEKITCAIGWIEDVFDVDKFDELMNYKNLTFPSDNFFDMARTIKKATEEKIFQAIPRNWSMVDTLMHSPLIDVNAFYVHSLDILILPTPILQGRIFDEDNPRYVNYGTLGTIIGHELSHGFDGSLAVDPNFHYWTNQTIENFSNVSECLRDEYDKHDDDLISAMNRNSTFEENVADYNGLHIAYRAYQNWVATYGREKGLPGIKYNPNQIFWLMASTYMCFNPATAKDDEFIKGHGVPTFRVNGRLRSSEEFARDFNCPLGSYMNPKKKCKIYA